MERIDRRGMIATVGMLACLALLPASALAQTLARQQPFRRVRFPRPRLLPRPAGTNLLAPQPPVYPVYDDLRPVIGQARALSEALERHVRAWLAGTAPAELPRKLIPQGTNSKDFRNFRLVRPEEIEAQAQWAIRPAELPMETANGYRGFFPDPNCTYLVVPAFYAPFGSKLVIEGQFPRARFFDIQVTPSFDPRSYRYDAAGIGEVPIVDSDIEPLPGHQNPFLPGARRDVERRGYRVEYELAMDDPVRANLAFRPPHFRGAGNRRVGGAIMFRGAWGIGAPGGDGRGAFAPGEIWVRYYRPDDGTVPFGGVPLPKAWCELPSGERYWIQADFEPYEQRVNRRTRPRATAPEPNLQHGEGADDGWYKQAGIFRAVITGIARNTGWGTGEYVRLLDKGVAARGSDLAPPNNYEQSATSATYIDYTVRGMSCGRGKVVVLTGKLPTFPDTGRGGGAMTPAQMRYWSIVGYAVPEGWDFLGAFSPDAVLGPAMHAVRDDEVVLGPDRTYVIVISRPEDRPSNATAEAGVTWVDWGPAGKIAWTHRWLSVGPQWKGSMMPTPERIGRRGEWGEPGFDIAAISENGWDGAIGEYLPRVGYMASEEFEQLGAKVTARGVPDWRG